MFTNSQLQLDDLPKLESIDFKGIDKRYFKVLLINVFAVYGILITVLTFFWFIRFEFKFMTMYWICLVLVLIMLIAQIVVYKLGFKLREYGLREKDITYKEGLLIHKQTTLPFNRIQHVELQRSFLSKQFGLATLKIYSAGESGSDLAIKGLPKEEASTINNFLIQLLSQRDAV